MQFLYSPADILANNRDLLTEILCRLPAKSLLRFKSVSKEWHSLISSSFFTSLHLRHQSFPPLYGVLFHRSSKSLLEFAFFDGVSHRPNPEKLAFSNDNHSNVRILQFCNGLLLCSARNGPFPSDRTFHVYNPTTGVSHLVPPSPPANDPTTTPLWMNLVFDPFKSPNYQLICIHNSHSSFSSSNHRHHQIHRYSSATRKWVPLSSPFQAPFNVVLTCGVYWRGSLHWLGPTWEDSSSSSSSLFFQLEDERLGSMPPVLHGDRRRKRRQHMLETSCDRLFLVEVYEQCEFRVLEMREDYSAWEVKYDIDIARVAETYPRVLGTLLDGDERVFGSNIYYKFQVCGVVGGGGGGGEEEEVVVMRIPGKLLGFGLESQRFWEMRDVLPSSQSASDFEWIDVFPYVETLACV